MNFSIAALEVDDLPVIVRGWLKILMYGAKHLAVQAMEKNASDGPNPSSG